MKTLTVAKTAINGPDRDTMNGPEVKQMRPPTKTLPRSTVGKVRPLPKAYKK